MVVTSDKLKRVVDWYASEFKRLGWTVTWSQDYVTPSRQKSHMFAINKGATQAQVSVMRNVTSPTTTITSDILVR